MTPYKAFLKQFSVWLIPWNLKANREDCIAPDPLYTFKQHSTALVFSIYNMISDNLEVLRNWFQIRVKWLMRWKDEWNSRFCLISVRQFTFRLIVFEQWELMSERTIQKLIWSEVDCFIDLFLNFKYEDIYSLLRLFSGMLNVCKHPFRCHLKEVVVTRIR